MDLVFLIISYLIIFIVSYLIARRIGRDNILIIPIEVIGFIIVSAILFFVFGMLDYGIAIGLGFAGALIGYILSK